MIGRKRLLLLLALFLSGVTFAVAGSAVRVVSPGERIVVRRFGRVLQPVWGPGFHFGLPLGVDRFDRVRTDEVRRLTLGSGGSSEPDLDPAAAELLTGDLNLVRIQVVVQYRVSRPADLLVSAGDHNAETLLGRLAESRLSRALATRGIDQALRDDRRQVAIEVRDQLAADMERDRLGIEILGVSLIDARPPVEVAGEFAAAQSAESERERRGNEARTRAESTVTAAKAKAHALLDAAAATAGRKLLTSRAEASHFLALLPEAQRSRTLTLQRLYIDKLQSLLARVRRKVVLPAGDAVDLSVLGIEE
jgi:membrane protease subunit HflK